MVCCSVTVQGDAPTEYVMVCVPAPAVLGEKVLLLTPVPVKVPPVVPVTVLLRLMALPARQTVPGLVHAGFCVEITVMVTAVLAALGQAVASFNAST